MNLETHLAIWERRFDQDELRQLLRPSKATPDESDRQRLTFAKLRTCLLDAMVIGVAVPDEAARRRGVEQAMNRALQSASTAERIGTLDSTLRTLRWISELATREVASQQHKLDDDLISELVGSGSVRFTRRERHRQSLQVANASVDDSVRDCGAADRTKECIRTAVENWLREGRMRSRHSALAMYLRFHFTGASREKLAAMYGRPSPEAVGQRNHETAVALRTATAHCFELDAVVGPPTAKRMTS